jgi:GTP pyrophosphokinase
MSKKDLFDDDDKNRIQAEYDSLINNLLRCNKEGDMEMITKAFSIANEAHWNMRRRSGEPYIIHPIAVA